MKQMLKRTGAFFLSLCLTLSVWGVLTPLSAVAAEIVNDTRSTEDVYRSYIDAYLQPFDSSTFPNNPISDEQVFSILIQDFNDDGLKEMLTFSLIYDNHYYIVLKLYKIENNAVVLCDTSDNIFASSTTDLSSYFQFSMCGMIIDQTVQIQYDVFTHGWSKEVDLYQSYQVRDNKLVLINNYTSSVFPRYNQESYVEQITGMQYSSGSDYYDALQAAGYEVHSHLNYDVNNDDYNASNDFKGNHIFTILNYHDVRSYSFVHDNTSFGKLHPSEQASSFESYFAKDLQKHFNDLIGEELPVKALIDDGGDISVNWNMFLQAVNSLLDFKLGVDEADFYQAVLLDLMKNTVTSVDYEKEMGKKTTDCIGVIASGLIDKGVEIADANLSSADLDHICDALKAQDMVGDVKLTYDSLKTLLKGCDSAEKCLDRIGSYITAWQEAEHLTAALRLMRQQAALDPNADTLVQCLDEMLQYMSMDQDELIFFCTSDTTFWETGTIVKNAICDHLLSLTKHVLPLSGAMDILELMNYSMDALFPTSTSSAQMYRLYALYHIEEITRSSLISANQAYLQDSSDEHAAVLTSCYDMFVRIYDHELKECDALAEMLYKNGIINKVKNFFFADKGEEDINNAKDWINSYQHGLDVIADYKNNAYIEWGLKLNKLQRICLVGITNGKITGYSEHYIETGTSMELPDFSSWCKILNERRAKPKEYHFEGWYYDAACTRPVMGNSVTANGPQIRYSKMTITSGKSVTFRGANDLNFYNAEHQTILRIANGKVVENANNLSIVLDGEKKQIFLPDGLDYSVEITATGSGNMSYSITESADGVSQRQINFYQIAQQIGQSFSGHIAATRNLPQSSYALTTQLGGTAQTILPDEMLETVELNRLNVEVSAVGSGKVSNGTLATKGDCFTVEAMPLSGAPFLGWYVNDVLVSTDVRYSFTVMEDVTLTAKFGEAVLLGDIDGNGKVDVTDALAILRMAVGLSTPTDNADMDGSGGVTVTDALAALRIAVGLA